MGVAVKFRLEIIRSTHTFIKMNSFFWSHRAASSPQIETIKYGYLYNWYVISDSRSIANLGWHIPTRNELRTLADFIGAAGDYSTNTIGFKLKETGVTYWTAPNSNATNETLFNARGAGIRIGTTGVFDSLTEELRISVNEDIATSRWLYRLLATSEAFSEIISAQKEGVSVRLIKDSTTLNNGETSTYTGNDGKVYRTICVGTQEWLADNLKETEYQNGDSVPEVTDNTAWSNLITGARCSYDNDENNA